MNLMELSSSLTLEAQTFINSANKAADVMEDLEKGAESVSDSFDKLSRSTSEFERSIQNQAPALEKASAGIERHIKALERQATVFGLDKEAALEMKRVFDIIDYGDDQEQIDRINAAYDKMAGVMAKAREEMEELGKVRGVDALAEKLNALSGLAFRMGAALTASVTAPIVKTASEALGLASSFQQAEIAFTTMLGSAEKAKGFLDELKDFAARTPFEFPDLLNAAKRLQALGFAAEDTIPIMRSVGDAVAGLGGGAALIDRVTTALGQMRAKGKVSAEEMRQLAEAGIPAWEALATKIGVSVPEAMKMASKGAIQAAEAIPAILAGMSEKFGNLMQNQMTTAEGQFSNFKDRITFILADIGKQLIPFATLALQLAEPLLKILQSLVDWFSKLPEPVKAVLVALTAATAAAGPFLLAFAGIANTLASALPVLASITAALGFGTGGLAMMLTALAPLAIAFGAAIAGWVLFKVISDMQRLNLEIEKFESLTKRGLGATAEQVAEIAVLEAMIRKHNQTVGLQSVLVNQASDSIEQSIGNIRNQAIEFDSAGKSGAEYLVFLRKLVVDNNLAGDSVKLIRKELADAQKNLDEVKKKYQEQAASLQDVTVAFDLVQKKKKELNNALETTKERLDQANAAVARYKEELRAAQAEFDKQNSAFEAGKQTYDKVADAQIKLQKAQDNFTSATVQARVAMQTLTGDVNQYSGSLDDMANRMRSGMDAHKSLEDQFKDLREEAKQADMQYKTLLKGYEAGTVTVEQLIAAYSRLQKAQQALNPQKFADAQAKANNAIEKAQSELIKKADELHAKMTKVDADLAQSATHFATELGKAHDKIQEATKKTIEIIPQFGGALRTSSAAVDEAKQKYVEAQQNLAKLRDGLASGKVTAEEFSKAQEEAKAAGDKWVNTAREHDKATREATVSTGRFGRELGQLPPNIREAVIATDNLNRAYEYLGIKSPEALKKVVTESKKAYEEIRKSTGENSVATLQARIKVYEAEIELARETGQKVTREQEKQLDKMHEQLDKALGKKRGLWETFSKQVSTIITDLGKDIADSLIDMFKGLLGLDDFNKKLDKDAEAIRQSLSERQEAWEEYVDEVAGKEEEIRLRHQEELEGEIEDLLSALGEKEAAYEEYKQEVETKIEELRAKHASELQKEIDDLMEAQREKEQGYTEYQNEIVRKIGEAREEHARELAEELTDLEDNLRDRRQAYEDFVEDATRKLNNIQEDLTESNSDDERSKNRKVEDENRRHTRKVQDLNDQLNKALNKGDQARAAEARLELQEEEEDYERTLSRISEDHAEAIADNIARAARETEETKLQLERRKRDFDDFVEENNKKRTEAVESHRTQLAEEEADLLRSLAKRTEDLINFREETATRIAQSTSSHASEMAKEEGELRDSLAIRGQELEGYRAATDAKIQEITAANARELGKELADLQKNFEDKLKEYTKFNEDAAKKLQELEELHKGPLDRIRDMFVSVFEAGANALLRIGSEQVAGLVIGKLKDIWDIISGIGKGLELATAAIPDSIFDEAGNIIGTVGGAAADVAGSAAGAAGSAAGGAASGAGGAAGAAGQVAGAGIQSIVGLVSGVVSAVSGVIGNFQMHGMNKTLDLIEHEVRFSQIHLKEILERGVNLFMAELPVIKQLIRQIVDNHIWRLEDIWGEMKNLNDTAKLGIDRKLEALVDMQMSLTAIKDNTAVMAAMPMAIPAINQSSGSTFYIYWQANDPRGYEGLVEELRKAGGRL